MSSTTDALHALLATARGERPKSLACAEAEEVLNIALALLVELAVAGDRIDRLERLVAELRGQPVDALRAITYDGDVAEERQAATDALIARALRIMVDPRAARAKGEAD
ncbi:MAG TPA: hypothetical protein VFO69_03320 [Allosphingosinicella sp.]|nr:hypothetical protein [Allosphingosinicella sp.]